MYRSFDVIGSLLVLNNGSQLVPGLVSRRCLFAGFTVFVVQSFTKGRQCDPVVSRNMMACELSNSDLGTPCFGQKKNNFKTSSEPFVLFLRGVYLENQRYCRTFFQF